MTEVKMNCQMCNFIPDHSGTARQQWDELDEHYNLYHDRRKNPMEPTLIQQIWMKLDNVMETALEWPGSGKNKTNPDNFSSDDEYLFYLKNRVEYVTQTSIGRGIAETLVILCQPAFTDSNQVVRHAVLRYKALKSGDHMPDTPGFSGPGQTGDSLRIAGQGKAASVSGAVTPKTTTDIAESATTSAANTHGLDEKQITGIRKAMANNFDIEQVATLYGVSKAKIKEICA